ncbi:MAG: pyrroline-5-carboxylate reductase [Hyphomonadaceae bacterium]|nr:pyrroline-5-carboxylate reductase [Hyphomonadaceae bacterium]
MQILMIGCGNMGSALLRRWADNEAMQFTVVDPATDFSHSRVTVLRDAESLTADSFDLMVVAIKPQLVADILPAYFEYLKPDSEILSMAAGLSTESLARLANGRAVIRIMPNMPAALGKGVSGLFATQDVRPRTLAMVETLMSATGELVPVETEDGLDRVTAIAGSGPGYVFEIARTYVEAAKQLGFDPQTSRKLVLGTLLGAVEMALQSETELADLRNSVTSKAGTTEAGLRALNDNDQLTELLSATTQAAYARAVELR